MSGQLGQSTLGQLGQPNLTLFDVGCRHVLAVTCHLLFWQNDQVLRYYYGSMGVEQMVRCQDKSQHKK